MGGWGGGGGGGGIYTIDLQIQPTDFMLCMLSGAHNSQTAWPCLGSAIERSWSALGGPFPPFLA